MDPDGLPGRSADGDRPADDIWASTGSGGVGGARSDLLIELADAAAVRSLQPDLGAIAALGVRCVIVTAAERPVGVDCVSRVFAPSAGIAEDPVTGSAHCTLAPFWAERLGRDELVGEQASARGGIVRMRLAGDRVILGGRAVTVSNVRIARL